MTDLQIYEKYCHNKPRSESLWRQCSDCAFFQVIGHFKFLRKKNIAGFDLTCFYAFATGVSEKAGAQIGIRFISAEACSEDYKISASAEGTLMFGC